MDFAGPVPTTTPGPVKFIHSSKRMKDRLLKNWTLTRALFVVLGTVVIVQAILERQWFGIVFGSYFASMGLFSFGCASGNCAGSCNIENKPVTDPAKKN